MTNLQTYTTGSVTRVSGADRYATAANLAASFPTSSPVFIATGKDFPDALAGTAPAAAQHAAILLTSPTSLPSGTATALSALAPSSITILGGICGCLRSSRLGCRPAAARSAAARLVVRHDLRAAVPQQYRQRLAAVLVRGGGIESAVPVSTTTP